MDARRDHPDRIEHARFDAGYREVVEHCIVRPDNMGADLVCHVQWDSFPPLCSRVLPALPASASGAACICSAIDGKPPCESAGAQRAPAPFPLFFDGYKRPAALAVHLLDELLRLAVVHDTTLGSAARTWASCPPSVRSVHISHAWVITGM